MYALLCSRDIALEYTCIMAPKWELYCPVATEYVYNVNGRVVTTKVSDDIMGAWRGSMSRRAWAM